MLFGLRQYKAETVRFLGSVCLRLGEGRSPKPKGPRGSQGNIPRAGTKKGNVGSFPHSRCFGLGIEPCVSIPVIAGSLW